MATLVWVTVCVGEWSRRPWYNSTFIHGRLVALALVIRQWRSRVGRWLVQSSHSTAEQSTTTTTRPRRHKLSSRAVVAITIMLQRTRITTLRCTPQQQWVGAAAVWRHLSIESLLSLSDWLITSPLTLTTLIYINITWTLTNYLMVFNCYSFKQQFTSLVILHHVTLLKQKSQTALSNYLANYDCLAN